MLLKIVFIIIHLISKPRVILYYLILNKNMKKTTEELISEQINKIIAYLNFCKNHVPYYNDIIPYQLNPLGKNSFRTYFDKIPPLTKNILRSCSDKLTPINCNVGKFAAGQTGGSTGEPLKYKMSRECSDMALAILYRGWGYGGYNLGDKMAIMAGGSLVSKKKSFKTLVRDYVMNIRRYSSYGVDPDRFMQYYLDINKWKPKYLRGYVVSIYEFAKFIEANDLTLEFKSIFTVAEMLLPHQRQYIEKVFNAEVFNTYGLNDGAVSAFECNLHDGFHIDTERGFLEVVDESGKAVIDQEGRILATSLLNKATPFVRYDTGDIGVISSKKCRCGSPYPLLESLKGRDTDALVVNGSIIGSPVLTVLMAGIPALRYQFVLNESGSLIINIEKCADYSQKDEDFIRESLYSQVGPFEMMFQYGEEFFYNVDGGKHRFIVKLTSSPNKGA